MKILNVVRRKRFRDIVEKNKSGYIAAGGDPVEFDALMELNKQAAKDVEEYMNKGNL